MTGSNALHVAITDEILEMLRTTEPNSFELPWTRSVLTRPTNALTQNTYSGVNILSLWAASLNRGYTSGLFATLRQWQQLGAHVRRGEKGATVVFYKSVNRGEEQHDPGNPPLALSPASPSSLTRPVGPRLITRASAVFAAEQVEGFAVPQPPSINSGPGSGGEQLDKVTRFIAATGARIIEGGERAYYRPSTDTIHLPPRSAFTGTRTLSANEARGSVALHELAHWTGHSSRLDRDLTQRFGSAAYAAEELVAELASAFLCIELGITPAPRPDHASYLKNWLQLLENDERAIFTAASQASRAVSFLHGMQPKSRLSTDNHGNLSQAFLSCTMGEVQTRAGCKLLGSEPAC